MDKFLFFLFFSLFIFISPLKCFAQTQSEQPENHFLKKAKSYKNNIDSSIYYTQLAIEDYKEKNKINEIVSTILYLSDLYRSTNKLIEANKLLQNALAQYQNKTNQKSNLYLSIGSINDDLSNYDIAINYYNKAKEIFEEENNAVGIAKALNNIGVSYKYKGKYPESINAHLESIKIYEAIGEEIGKGDSYGNIANVYEELGNINDAYKYYEKALDIFSKTNNQEKLATTYMNLGVIDVNIGNLNDAVINFEKSKKVAEENNIPIILSYSLNNLAYTYSEMGDLDKSIIYFKKAISTAENLGNKWGIANSSNNLAEIYLRKNDTKKSIEYLENSLKYINEIGAIDLKLENYDILYRIHEKNKEFNKALNYYKLYVSLKDSLYNIENKEIIADAVAKYESEKKDNELKNSKLEQQQKSIMFMLILIALLIVIGVVVFLFFRYRVKTSKYLRNVINSLEQPFCVYDVVNNKIELLNNAGKKKNSPYNTIRESKDCGRNLIPRTGENIIKNRKAFSSDFDEEPTNNRKFEYHGFPILNKKGEVVKIIEYALDVTEKNEALSRIKSALEREKELNELKTNFISSTSHEFRTPLATLMSSLELVQYYDKIGEYDKKFFNLEKIKEIIKSLSKMIDDMLVINRADADKLEFTPKKFLIQPFIDEIIDEVKVNAKKNHTINVIFRSKIYDIFVDPVLTKLILVNLLNNSIKYSPFGGKINLEIIIDDDKILIVVTDNGIGIPQNDQKYLFQDFYRAKNVGIIHGVGLGLSIVKRSVEIQRGKIIFESKENEGSTFTVELPLKFN